MLTNTPFVSVIVPAFNASDSLPLCLERLCQQTYPASHLEIIVVDNHAAPTLRELVARFPDVVYLHEPRAGSYAARNCAIRRARGTLLAFTDADCVPQHHWVERGIEVTLATTNCGLVGGRVQLEFENPQAPGVWEICDHIVMGFPQIHCVQDHNFSMTANLFTRREVFESVGLFDEALRSTGDLDWGRRVHNAGYAQIYAHTAVVTHPARHTRSQIFEKARRVEGGRMGRQRKSAANVTRLRRAVRQLRQLALMPTKALNPARKFAKLRDYRLPDGSPLALSSPLKTRVLLALLAMGAVQQIEFLRLIAGSTPRR